MEGLCGGMFYTLGGGHWAAGNMCSAQGKELCASLATAGLGLVLLDMVQIKNSDRMLREMCRYL
jgi:hypothetical protein